MPRKVRRNGAAAAGTLVWYTPTADDNHQAAEEDQVRVKIRHPYDGELAAIRAVVAPNMTTAQGILAVCREACRKCVVEVTGYLDDQDNEITTGAEFALKGETDFVINVGNEVIKRAQLDPAKKKSLGVSPGSPSEAMPASKTTTADRVAPNGSTRSGDVRPGP